MKNNFGERGNRIIVYISDELKDRLNKEAKEKMIKRSPLISNILESFYKEKTENKYQFLDDSCPALAFEDNTFICVWGRKGKTPDIKKLGKTVSLTEKICKACKATRDTIKIEIENKELKNQLLNPIIVSMPQCIKGGRINETMEEFWCPDIGKSRPILKRKKNTDCIPCKSAGKYNSQCVYLRFKDLEIKERYQPVRNR